MTTHNAGVILNGVTGRMGTRQHLIRSILAIREQGGVQLNNGDVVMPDPILVGRNEKKLAALAEAHSLSRWTTDLSEALQDEYNVIYFDSQTTDRRQEAIKQAIAAGKHIYCEKPTATSMEGSLELARMAEEAGVKNGVVQDKLFLPGIMKLKRLLDANFLVRFYRSAWSLATGCLRGTGKNASVHPGTIRRSWAEALSWICSLTGAMCWMTCLAG